MRIVFMGSPQFAADILDEISNIYDVACVYTQPDKVRGRGKKLIPTPVKEIASAKGIQVRTPVSLDEDEVLFLKTLKPDFICVAAYGVLLPKDILDIPPYGCINVHASLLPRWRGAAPIERAILAGDEFAGVCIMKMEEGLDTGDYCVSRRIPIEGMSSIEVEQELASLGAAALVVAINQIGSGAAKWVEQDDSQATYAHKIEKGELDLDPKSSSVENLRRVLASGVAHPSKIELDGRSIAVISASISNEVVEEGKLSTVGKKLVLGCFKGSLEVLKLKPAGKNEMTAKAFLAGAKLPDDAVWS